MLDAASDLGLVHFDTAPAYGDGLAETELGRFLRGRRNQFIIATKYGIPADPIIERLPIVAPYLRGVRALTRRIGLWRNRQPPLTAAGLRQSAERSLRRLGTDRIDILFLHEPHLQRMEDSSDILEEFGRLTQRGLIRAFGLAGSWSGIGPLLAAAPELAEILQTAETEWPAESPPDITYGALAADPQSYFAASIGAEVAVQRLRSALNRRPQGVVLVSTTKTDHLRLLAEAAEGLSA